MKKLYFFCVFLLFLGKIFAAKEIVKIYPSLEGVENRDNLPVVLCFFDLNCSMCYDRLFDLKLFIEDNDMNIMLVGVSCELESELVPFLKKYSFHYPVVNDLKMKLFRRFKVHAPCVVICVNGQVQYKDDPYKYSETNREKAKEWLKRRMAGN